VIAIVDRYREYECVNREMACEGKERVLNLQNPNTSRTTNQLVADGHRTTCR